MPKLFRRPQILHINLLSQGSLKESKVLRKKLAPSWHVVSFPKGPAIILGDLPHLLTPLLLGTVVTAPSHPIQPAQGPLQEKQNICDLKEVQEVNDEQLWISDHRSHQGIVVLDQQLIALPLELALQGHMQEGLGLCHPDASSWVACWILVNLKRLLWENGGYTKRAAI